MFDPINTQLTFAPSFEAFELGWFDTLRGPAHALSDLEEDDLETEEIATVPTHVRGPPRVAILASISSAALLVPLAGAVVTTGLLLF